MLIALSAKNAILIVEIARQWRTRGEPLMACAVAAARARLRPLVMTSFAFILGVKPLVLPPAPTRAHAGLSASPLFSGMLASTCLGVLFVLAFFAVMQRVEEWRIGKRRRDAVVG